MFVITSEASSEIAFEVVKPIEHSAAVSNKNFFILPLFFEMFYLRFPCYHCALLSLSLTSHYSREPKVKSTGFLQKLLSRGQREAYLVAPFPFDLHGLTVAPISPSTSIFFFHRGKAAARADLREGNDYVSSTNVLHLPRGKLMSEFK